MNAKLFGGVISFGCLWGGGQGLYTSIFDSTPVVKTCSEFLAKPGEGHRLELSGCVLDLTEALQVSSGSSKNYYVPVRASLEAADEPVLLLTHIVDPKLIALIEPIFVLAGDRLVEYVQKNVDGMSLENTKVSGLIRFGIESDDSTRKAIEKVRDMKLAKDWMIVDSQAGSSVGLSIAMLLFGLFAGWMVVRPQGS